MNDNTFLFSFLFLDKKPCFGLLNPNEEDEMKITGYRRSRMRTALCWLCICLTGGLLRLILHWWRHWYLMATHEICTLEEADKVLVQEDYKGNHKIYYVKQIQNLDINTLRYVRTYQSTWWCIWVFPCQIEQKLQQTFLFI